MSGMIINTPSFVPFITIPCLIFITAIKFSSCELVGLHRKSASGIVPHNTQVSAAFIRKISGKPPSDYVRHRQWRLKLPLKQRGKPVEPGSRKTQQDYWLTPKQHAYATTGARTSRIPLTPSFVAQESYERLRREALPEYPDEPISESDMTEIRDARRVSSDEDARGSAESNAAQTESSEEENESGTDVTTSERPSSDTSNLADSSSSVEENASAANCSDSSSLDGQSDEELDKEAKKKPSQKTRPLLQGDWKAVVDVNSPLEMFHPAEAYEDRRYRLNVAEDYLLKQLLWQEKVKARRRLVMG